MKQIAWLAALLFVASDVLCQGTINFANGGAGVNAPIGDPSGTGGSWLAMLYAGPAGAPWRDLTVVSGGPAELGVNGYVFGGLRTVAGIPSGTPATLQIRVWAANYAASWEEAWNKAAAQPLPHQRFFLGALTQPITIVLGGGPTPTPNMVGLAGASIGPIYVDVPEPALPAMLCAGVCVWGVVRRRGTRKEGMLP